MIERAHIEFMKMGMAPNVLLTNNVSSNTKANRTTTKELSEY